MPDNYLCLMPYKRALCLITSYALCLISAATSYLAAGDFLQVVKSELSAGSKEILAKPYA
jgi:hypothetical protein